MTGTRALPSAARPQAGRRPGRGRSLLATGAALTALVGAGLLAPATAGATPAHAPATDAVQRELDALVTEDDFPAVLASVSDGRRVRDLAAGVADVATGEPAPVNGRVRIASNTKTFTATVVLQLVAEGRVGLDQPVERYLPGVVRGPGGDGRQITVRQLLQQTSGLPDYDDVLFEDWVASGLRGGFTTQQLLDAALGKPATERGVFSYANTNYVLAGMLVEEVTDRSIGEEIERRIIRPLGLRQTYWPADDDLTVRGRHPHTYTQAEAGGPLTDVTELNPTIGGAAGQLISTPRDLATFFRALLGGRLLPAAQLAQMQTTVPADLSIRGIDTEYGLGLAAHELPCGVEAWGHGGDLPGVHTRNAFTTDGRGVTLTVTGEPANADPADVHQFEHLEEAVDRAACAQLGR